ncbi:MAG TPA: RnfABCDGE type electron transport complex subunit D [Clostridiales bacterium]|nr:RnfABCDGE type electron transport complex subunit D [Clostridiales bacterium]
MSDKSAEVKKEVVKDKYIVSSSPHVGTNLTTKKIMLHVIIALSFPLIAGVVIFGLYSLFIVGLSVAGAVFGEWIYNKARKAPITVYDLSAVVTGLILGLNLPPTVPFYIPVVGGIFATLFVKMLFGGLGKNFANPAATARVFLSLSWTAQMTRFMSPINYAQKPLDFFAGFNNIVSSAKYITSATPLGTIKTSAQTGFVDVNLLDMFLGKIGGSIGEVCAIAIILSLIYLLVFKIIDWKIPLTYIVSVIIFTLIFYKKGYNFILPTLLSGGLLFGAIFMLTDYATAPKTFWGVITYAALAGLLTILIRRYGGYPEGVCLSIVLVNIVAPLLDKIFKPRPLGYVKKKKKEA